MYLWVSSRESGSNRQRKATLCFSCLSSWHSSFLSNSGWPTRIICKSFCCSVSKFVNSRISSSSSQVRSCASSTINTAVDFRLNWEIKNRLNWPNNSPFVFETAGIPISFAEYWRNSITDRRGLKTYANEIFRHRRVRNRHRTRSVFPVPTSPVTTMNPFRRSIP